MQQPLVLLSVLHEVPIQQPLVLWSVLHEVTITVFALEQLPSFLMTLLDDPKTHRMSYTCEYDPAQQAAYTAALITEAGGELSKVSTSCSAVDRS